MSRKIYLLRHGKPNIEGKRCIGLTDVPLSEEGKEQARKIGSWLEGQGIQKIYSSPLSRCRETAEMVVSQAFSEKKIIHIREDLREMSVGQWENLSFDEIKERYPKEYAKRGENIGYYAPPEGESFDEAGKRFCECLNGILDETDGDVLVVAHAGVIRGYLCQLTGISANCVMDFPQPYCGLTLLEQETETADHQIRISRIGWKPEQVLDADEIKEIYKKCKTPEKVIRHMEAVAEYLEVIKAGLKGDFDWNLLKKAALLHDIKRTEKNHAEAGAEFLRREGYTELAELIQYHHSAKMSESELLTEEELLFYADKRVQEDRIVSIEERFAASKAKCQSPEAVEKHRKLYEKSKMIEVKQRNNME